ncbi:MAG TPA: HAMP domain-containing sensor histidine kinase [Myxococcales bacterium]|nr:HAMP domain-containing sensor histidine kinase [Myxococcales bacterium]
MPLHHFLSERRDEVLRDAGDLIRSLRPSPGLEAARAENLSAFLEAVIDGLKRRESLPADPVPEPRQTGPAREHPNWERYDLDEVVHEYGSLCNSIMKVANRHAERISMEQHQALIQALHENIAADVLACERKRRERRRSNAAERLGFVAHELRNALHTAALSFQAIRSGHVPARGATGSVLERSHNRLRELVDRLIAQVRLGAGAILRRDRLLVGDLVRDSVATVAADVREKKIRLSVEQEAAQELKADGMLLVSALSNLLQNAVKFTGAGGRVSLRALPHGGRVWIDRSAGGARGLAATLRPCRASSPPPRAAIPPRPASWPAASACGRRRGRAGRSPS